MHSNLKVIRLVWLPTSVLAYLTYYAFAISLWLGLLALAFGLVFVLVVYAIHQRAIETQRLDAEVLAMMDRMFGD